MTANGQQHWWNAPSGARLGCGGICVRDKGAHRLVYYKRPPRNEEVGDYVALELRAADGEKGAVYVQRRDHIYRCDLPARVFWRGIARRWQEAVGEKVPPTGLQLEAIALGGERLSPMAV